ncbi:hypothetical protein LPJ57_007500, partial [Coemansia sp. RSA 486]
TTASTLLLRSSVWASTRLIQPTSPTTTAPKKTHALMAKIAPNRTRLALAHRRFRSNPQSLELQPVVSMTAAPAMTKSQIPPMPKAKADLEALRRRQETSLRPSLSRTTITSPTTTAPLHYLQTHPNCIAHALPIAHLRLAPFLASIFQLRALLC